MSNERSHCGATPASGVFARAEETLELRNDPKADAMTFWRARACYFAEEILRRRGVSETERTPTQIGADIKAALEGANRLGLESRGVSAARWKSQCTECGATFEDGTPHQCRRLCEHGEGYNECDRCNTQFVPSSERLATDEAAFLRRLRDVLCPPDGRVRVMTESQRAGLDMIGDRLIGMGKPDDSYHKANLPHADAWDVAQATAEVPSGEPAHVATVRMIVNAWDAGRSFEDCVGILESSAAPAAPVKSEWTWPVKTVRDLIANLQTLPPETSFYTAYFVEIDGKRVARTRSPSMSWETTDGFRIEKYSENARSLVIWASQDERPSAVSATARTAEKPEMLDDGFGNQWQLCRADCALEIVRPGKVQCSADDCPHRTENPSYYP